MKKKKFVIGNWKMNPETLKEAKELAEGIRRKIASVKKATAVMCPPAIFFSEIKGKSTSKKLFYGLQNVGKERAGALTGETSVVMAKSLGATYAIIGHSERRAMGDTDEDINKKICLLLKEKIHPVFCVGEPKMDDQAGYLPFIKNQLVKGLNGVSPADLSQIIIAYEPIAAIGAKFPFTSHEIHQRNIFIKKVLADLYGKAKAFEVPILYGGSANAENARELVEGGEVDGLLVGRDSLKAENFITILKEMDKLS